MAMTHLSLGTDFGHVIDLDSNLYGWGNNKHGELGTGDSYPRIKLSQVRIFNSEKQYMRCLKVFNGHNFSVGLFESFMSPNGIAAARSRSVGPLMGNNFAVINKSGLN